MTLQPSRKRAVAFFDGQNLFHCAREAFGHSHPNYDVSRLSRFVCDRMGWDLEGIRFYTGVPPPRPDPYWHEFWARKLAEMGKSGITIHARPLRRRLLADPGAPASRGVQWVDQEKGIDVRIAIDVIRLAHLRAFDVAVIFSQDQDFVEVAREIREIAREQRRWIKIASAFPRGASSGSSRGIDGTDWIPIDRDAYDACLDPRDYRTPSP